MTGNLGHFFDEMYTALGMVNAPLSGIVCALEQVRNDPWFSESFEGAVDLVRAALCDKQTVFFIGNGGSAAIAAHMAADFAKAGKVRTRCFESSSTLTAISNDQSFEEVYSSQILQYGEQGDLLVAISSSGRSKNILLGVGAARSRKMQVITLSGFDEDNPLRQLGNVNFHVPAHHYGLVEVTHHAIIHGILDSLTNVRPI